MSRLDIFIALVFCTCILLPFLGLSTEFRSRHWDNNNLRQEGNNYPHVLNIMTIQPEFGVHSTLGRLVLISVISFLHVVTHATSQSLFGFVPRSCLFHRFRASAAAQLATVALLCLFWEVKPGQVCTGGPASPRWNHHQCRFNPRPRQGSVWDVKGLTRLRGENKIHGRKWKKPPSCFISMLLSVHGVLIQWEVRHPSTVLLFPPNQKLAVGRCNYILCCASISYFYTFLSVT